MVHMVGGNPKASQPASGHQAAGSRQGGFVAGTPARVLQEKVKALTKLYSGVQQLIKRWGLESEFGQEAVLLAGAQYYHELCRWLDEGMRGVEQEIISSGAPVELKPLQDARDELRVILAFKPEDLVKGRADARTGRVITLDEMRRELQDRSH